jgi:hypothetical protein
MRNNTPEDATSSSNPCPKQTLTLYRWPSHLNFCHSWEWQSPTEEYGIKPRIRIVSLPAAPISNERLSSASSSEVSFVTACVEPRPEASLIDVIPIKPIKLYSPEGSVVHTFRTVNKEQALSTPGLNRGKQSRARPDAQSPYIVAGCAIKSRLLTRVSDFARTGVWVVAPGREDVVAALQEISGSKWRLIGLGVGKSEGCAFMLYPCRPGPRSESPQYGQKEGLFTK